MGAKGLSPMHFSENPEDWHMSHMRTDSNIWTPRFDDLKKPKVITTPDSSKSSTQCTDEPEPEGEDGKPAKIGGLVKQLEGLVTQLESSDSAVALRLQAVEEEKRHAVECLTEKINSLEEERIAQTQEHSRLLDCLAKHERDNERMLLESQKMLARLSEKDALDHQHESLKRDFDVHKEQLQQQFSAFQETSCRLEQLEKENQQLTKEKQEMLAQLTALEGVEQKYHELECAFAKHKENAANRIENLEVSVERLAVVEKQRAELANKVSSLNEQITDMQATSTAHAVESAATLERLGEQYQDIFQLVQEKQQKLAKLAAQESVPFDFYHAAKRQCQAVQEEFDTHKANANEQITMLEATLKTQASQHKMQTDSDKERLEAVESERDSLNKSLALVNKQIAAMQSASCAQAVESATVLERLSKQYREIFHVMQEKQELLSGLAAQEKQLQEGFASESLDGQPAQSRHLELQSEFASYKDSTNKMLSGLETSLQAQACEYQVKLSTEAQRLATVETERSDLSKAVQSLTKQLASSKDAHASSEQENARLVQRLSTQESAIQDLLKDKELAENRIATQDAMLQDRDELQQRLATQENAIHALTEEKEKAIERLSTQTEALQETVPLEEFQAMKAQYQALQQDFETHCRVNGKCFANKSTQSGFFGETYRVEYRDICDDQSPSSSLTTSFQPPVNERERHPRLSFGDDRSTPLRSSHFQDFSLDALSSKSKLSDMSHRDGNSKLFMSTSSKLLSNSTAPLRNVSGGYSSPLNRLTGSLSLSLGHSRP